MKTVIVLLIFLTFMSCIQAKSNCSFQKVSVRVDTICNYVVYRTAVDIQLPDSLNFASDERAFVCVQVDEVKDGKIVKWSISTFRVYKKDSITFNYSGSVRESPFCIHKYIPLIDKFVETVKVEERHGKKREYCRGLCLYVKFLNTK